MCYVFYVWIVCANLCPVKLKKRESYDTIDKTWATRTTTLFHRAIKISLKTSVRERECPMKQTCWGAHVISFVWYQLWNSSTTITYALPDLLKTVRSTVVALPQVVHRTTVYISCTGVYPLAWRSLQLLSSSFSMSCTNGRGGSIALLRWRNTVNGPQPTRESLTTETMNSFQYQWYQQPEETLTIERLLWAINFFQYQYQFQQPEAISTHTTHIADPIQQLGGGILLVPFRVVPTCRTHRGEPCRTQGSARVVNFCQCGLVVLPKGCTERRLKRNRNAQSCNT
jgi:hypothetical protein